MAHSFEDRIHRHSLFTQSLFSSPSPPSPPVAMYFRSLAVSFFLALPYAGFAVAQSRPYPITGLTGGVNTATGERPARLEITTLQNSGPQWCVCSFCLQAPRMDMI